MSRYFILPLLTKSALILYGKRDIDLSSIRFGDYIFKEFQSSSNFHKCFPLISSSITEIFFNILQASLAFNLTTPNKLKIQKYYIKNSNTPSPHLTPTFLHSHPNPGIETSPTAQNVATCLSWERLFCKYHIWNIHLSQTWLHQTAFSTRCSPWSQPEK